MTGENTSRHADEKGETDSGDVSRFFDVQDFVQVPVMFRNLSVITHDTGRRLVKTLPRAILNTFGYDQITWLRSLLPSSWRANSPSQARLILRNCYGVINPGEMLLVLGPPGSGCSTLLRTVANQSKLRIQGDLSYAGVPHQSFRATNRRETVYLPEEDRHIATLTVRQTLVFALRTNLPRETLSNGRLDELLSSLASSFGLEHCLDTIVSEVSGGERKRYVQNRPVEQRRPSLTNVVARVSIAEVLAACSSVQCFDNSTRGLDSSTALDFVKLLRSLADARQSTILATLYQAGENLYSTFDKILLLCEGRQIFFGRTDQARQYFEDLGFIRTPGETTSEFLTSITDPTLRKVSEGTPAASCTTPDDLVTAFHGSEIFARLRSDIDAAACTQQTIAPSRPVILPYVVQVWECLRRELQLLNGKRMVTYQKWINTIILCLIVGSEYFDVSTDAQGAFTRESIVFYAIIANAWMQYPELFDAHTNRPVLERQSALNMYRPSAVAAARILVDIPFLAVQHALFMVAYYFLSHNRVNYTAGDFFFFYLVLLLSTINFANLLRMFAYYVPTVEDCFRFGGIASTTTVYFAGFLIPINEMFPVWSWLHYISPPRYTYEALLTNEFHRFNITCADSLIPAVPGANLQNQVCAVRGARAGQETFSGLQYVSSLGFEYGHRWRNVGILFAFASAYMIVGIVGSELMTFTSQGGNPILFSRRDASGLDSTKPDRDVEKEANFGKGPSESRFSMVSPASSQSLIWKDFVVEIGDKRILKGISGYVRPGDFVALCGASGAGKTTLLTHLSKINSTGTSSGILEFGGQAPAKAFRRLVGFAQQQDFHNGTATVREALEFSAKLRQSSNYGPEEQLAYVERVLDVLDLRDYEHALIGDADTGLSVEMTKRVTIGVELAARPRILFADEPTSGLDSRGAASIIQYLKKLAEEGQAVLVTVHQPSATLFNLFDKLVALSSHGEQLYFGPVHKALQYFERYGVAVEVDQNPAEFILETIGAGIHGKAVENTNVWAERWSNSDENQQLVNDIDNLRRHTRDVGDESEGTNTFNTSTLTQTRLLTARMLRDQWRKPSYVYSKIWVHTIQAILIGFTFFQLGTSPHDLQSRAFGAFALIFLVNTIVNPVLARFFGNRALWKVREGPSRAYGWAALCHASMLAEMPAIVFCSVVYYLLWYFLSGLPLGAAAGATFLIIMTYEVFEMTLGLFITAASPDLKVAGLVLVFLVTTCNWFNGVVVPYDQIQVFWRFWVYYLNPLTYLFGAMILAANKDIAVVCDPEDTFTFPPPAFQTCQEYAGAWASQAGAQLLNPSASDSCVVCPYQNGNQYLAMFNLFEGQLANNMWAYWAVFLLFTVSNIALFYFLTWARQVKGLKLFYFF